MKALDEILKEYFGCEKSFPGGDGDLTDAGATAYGRLTRLLYDLESLGALADADMVIETLDGIVSGKEY